MFTLLQNLKSTHHITKGDYKSLKGATCLLNSSEGKDTINSHCCRFKRIWCIGWWKKAKNKG